MEDSDKKTALGNRAFSVEIEMPSTRHGTEKVLGDLKNYFVQSMKRKAIEVSERRLTEEKMAFNNAKAIEVNNFIAAKAFEALPPEMQVSKQDAIHMRWILAWKTKPDGSKKAKARAVLQGYMDPHYEDRATHSPTTTRLSRQLQRFSGFQNKKRRRQRSLPSIFNPESTQKS